VRQSETRARQSKHGSKVGPLSNSTSTWEGTREVMDLQLGPLATPTHCLGFCESTTMCFLFVFFCFVCSSTSFETIVLRFERD